MDKKFSFLPYNSKKKIGAPSDDVNHRQQGVFFEKAIPRRCNVRKKWCPEKSSTFYCRLHCGSGVGAGFSVPWVGFLCSVGAGAGWGGEALSTRSQRFAAPGFPAPRPRARPSAGETLKIAVTAPASHFRSENGPKMSPKTVPAGPKVGTVFDIS